MDRIDASGDCWEWLGGTTGKGYGVAYVTPGVTTTAHRVVWCELVGSIPAGLELDHLCRNKMCVNPDHLEPVTHSENLRRRQKWHHPAEGQRTHGTTTCYGYHGCRCDECRAANTAAHRKYVDSKKPAQ